MEDAGNECSSEERILRRVGFDFMTNRPMYGAYSIKSFDKGRLCSLERMYRKTNKEKSITSFGKVFPRYVNHYRD